MRKEKNINNILRKTITMGHAKEVEITEIKRNKFCEGGSDKQCEK
jgi:hypothetical protein